MKIKRSQLKEMVKSILKEGTTDMSTIDKWNRLLDEVGSDTMLDCVFNWSSSDQIEQWIEWFEEEGYIDSDMYESRSNKNKRNLNEVSGWTLEEDDIEWVNDKGDDYYSDDDAWIVRLWPGSGYYLPSFGVYANHEQEALEIVVAYLEKTGNDDFFVDDYVDSIYDQMEEDGADEETIWDIIDNDESIMYVDATMEGASKPHYIYAENLAIYPYSNFKGDR